MHKRILSIVLCLAMMMSFAVPAYATNGTAENGDIYIADDIIVSDGAVTTSYDEDGNIVIKMNSEETETPAEETETPVEETEAPAEETEAPAEETEAPAEETEAPVEETEAPTEETEAEEEITVEEIVLTGEAMATIAGTTVNVSGIPEGGSVTLQDPADSLAVEQADNVDEMIFLWDISVQDANGAEWQPQGEETVHVELNVPGVKLHKYTKVYVMHIDDEGNESRIEAEVTEDGRIAFETPGFSTFAGFTVDFAFEGVEFSIPGETSILLSQVFENLKAPLNVADVANVEFTNNELITVTKVDGDWELTSLKAFTSEETLTITMNDGKVYKIDVTDDPTNPAEIYVGGEKQDSGGNGIVTWNLYWGDEKKLYQNPNLTGCSGAGNDGYTSNDDGYTFNDDIIEVRGPGQFQIDLQGCADTMIDTYYLYLKQIKITNGAQLTIRLGRCFNPGEKIIIKGTADMPIFNVEDGGLFIRVSSENQTLLPSGTSDSGFGDNNTDANQDGKPDSYVELIVDGGDKATTAYSPLIYTHRGIDQDDRQNLVIEDVIFRNAKHRAILVETNELDRLQLYDCTFESTVRDVSHGGGAIYIGVKSDGSTANMVDVHRFVLDNCVFNSNVASGGYGGAILQLGNVHSGLIKDCQFNNCESKTQGGGAIGIAGGIGVMTIQDTSFTGCTSKYRGGAVEIRSNYITNGDGQPRWTRMNTVSFSGCTFSQCSSTNSHGGAIAVKAQLHTLSVSGSSFSNCIAGINGGAISIDGQDLDYDHENGTIDYFKDEGGSTPSWAGGVECSECITNYETVGTVLGGSYDWKNNEASAKTTDNKSLVGTVNITNNCTFTNCSSASNGGSIEFASGCYITNSATISNTTITGSKAVDGGSAIFTSNCIVKKLNLYDDVFQNCDFNPGADDVGGTVRTTGQTTIVMDVQRCKFLNNHSIGHAGGLYWNAARTLEGITCEATVHDCLFDGNRVDMYGGAIYVESKMTITKCHIKNNTAAVMGGGIAQQVYNNPGVRMMKDGDVTELKLDPDTWVHHNSAPLGGGISIKANETDSIVDGDLVDLTVRFELNGAAVYRNTAYKDASGKGGHGGGIYFIAESSTDPLKQAEVENYTKVILINAGTGTAAAVYDNSAAGNGGGIYMESSENTELRVQGGHISSNEAANGGGIYMTGKNATCYVEGGIIGGAGKDSNGQELANVASGNGGGIAISGGAKIEMNKSAGATTGGTISYNKAYAFGGGIWLDAKGTGTDDVGNKIIINEGIITSNTASGAQTDDNGGGIALLNGSEAELNGGTISKNHADYRGGGIFARGATVKLNGSDIYENTGKCSGGGILGDRGSLITINSGDIYKNSTSNGWGGGIYLTDSGTKVTMNGGNIYENATTVVGGCGGGINAEVNCTVTISGGNIYKNTASLYGGGVHSYNNASVNVVGGSIHENTAVYGGGIAVRNNSTCTVTKSKTDVGRITKNTAKNGGGVFVASGADLTVHDGYIIQNIAQGKPAAGVTTAYYDTADGGVASSALLGVGGGIYVADGSASNNPATFTLTGDNVAIYGNIAEFAADDVFANGKYTKLNVPKVAGMNLEGYDFPAAGWVEDYPVNDSHYEYGLSFGHNRDQNVVSNGSNVYRYRFSRPGFRIVVPEANVTTEKFAPNVANEYVCMTLGIPVAEPDVVVVDFGLPVKIDVSANDLIIDVEPIHGFVVDEHVNSKGYNEASPNSDGSCSLCNTEGTQNSSGGFVLNDDKHSATFTPADMNFSGAQTVNYVVHYSIKDSNGADKFYHFYSTVTAIPATNIYYEDSFLTFTDAYNDNTNFGKWVEVTDETAATASTDVTQQQDRPGEDVNNALGALDADNVYGYDEAYKNCTTYSLGSAMKVTVDKSTGSANNAPTANFTFTGTGFDVVSLTDSDSGCVWVTVKDKNGKQVKSVIVSNYYGYTYDPKSGEWVVDPNESDCLYQVPVIKVDDLAYGTYNVEIKVVYLRSQDMDRVEDKPETHNYTVWLDAIRVYNPAKNDTTSNNTYIQDGENNPFFTTVKSLLVGPGDFTAGSTEVNGTVFVDGKSDGVNIADYKNQGPNNETYLKNGNGIAFKLRHTSNSSTAPVVNLQIGAKLATGTSATMSFKQGTSGSEQSVELTTSTNMFYKIGAVNWTEVNGVWESDPFIIWCSAADEGSILSLTDIKATGANASAITTMPATSTTDGSTNSDAGNMVVLFDTEVSKFIDEVFGSDDQLTTGSITLNYPTLSFEDEVKYNFYYTVKNIDVAVEDMGLITWSTKPEDATFDTAETVIPGASYNAATGEYMVRTNGIPAKKLGDDVYFRVYAKLSDGSYVYSRMTYYSAKIYAAERLKYSTSADMKAACVAMLNYGAAAQMHFDYKTDALMNADLTAEQKALVDAYSSDMVDALPTVDAAKAGEFVANGGFNTGYPTVSFEGAFAINYYFVPNKTIDGDLTLYCWDLETYNSVDVLTADNATAKIVMSQTITGEYFATYTGIAAKQIDEAVFVAGVYESEGVRYSTNVVPYSVGAYCADRVAYGSDTMKVFAAETAVFGHYAEIYFDNLNK